MPHAYAVAQLVWLLMEACPALAIYNCHGNAMSGAMVRPEVYTKTSEGLEEGGSTIGRKTVGGVGGGEVKVDVKVGQCRNGTTGAGEVMSRREPL